MYSVRMLFDTDRLGSAEIEAICSWTDEIFEEESIVCEKKDIGERIYSDSGEKQGFGRLWAALFSVKDTPAITKGLKICTWQRGDIRENLITDFFNR